MRDSRPAATYRAIALGAAIIVLVCLCGAAAAYGLLASIRGGISVPFVRAYFLQRSAQANACPSPASLVPGSYQADPMWVVEDYLAVTYTAECDWPGRPRMAVEGYYANNSRGSGCGGTGTYTPPSAPAGGSVTIEQVGRSGCSGNQPADGITVISGSVSGGGVDSVEVVYADMTAVSAPLRNGHFAVVAPAASPPCMVRALDASGAVLAEEPMPEFPGPPGSAPPGTCP
jgi:hypothetical protein